MAEVTSSDGSHGLMTTRERYEKLKSDLKEKLSEEQLADASKRISSFSVSEKSKGKKITYFKQRGKGIRIASGGPQCRSMPSLRETFLLRWGSVPQQRCRTRPSADVIRRILGRRALLDRQYGPASFRDEDPSHQVNQHAPDDGPGQN